MPFTGVLQRNLNLYPFPGHSPADSVVLGTPLADNANLIWFFAVVNGTTKDLHLCTWDYVTNTFTDKGVYGNVPFADPNGRSPLCCWNADKTAIYVFNWTANVSNNFRFWTYTIATDTFTDNGTFSVAMGTISDARWDPVLNKVIFASYQDVYVAAWDPVTHVDTTLVKMLRCSWMLEPTTDYIYCFYKYGGGPGVGPVVRLHRNKFYFAENLCGVFSGGVGGVSVGSTIPHYANLNFTARGLTANNAGEVLFAGDNGVYYIDPVTRDITNIINVGSARSLFIMPNGKLLVQNSTSFISVYA